VLGLSPRSAPRPVAGVLDPALQQRVTRLARDFAGTAAVYAQDLVTGRGAAWNARARFPAASTLKLAVAVETLRSVRGPPAHGSRVDLLLRKMIIGSDNAAANELEALIGGSTIGGSALINATMQALGLTDTDMYGGYELPRPIAERPIPVETQSQPPVVRTKYTTAWDLSSLFRYLHLAAGGQGPLLRRVSGFAPTEARYLLYLLAHVRDGGKLGRFLPESTVLAHKAGWITMARHDGGIVYWPGGSFVATVMTWAASGVGTASDVLAGRVAETTWTRFRERR
jgi:beta-lactamase class A